MSYPSSVGRPCWGRSDKDPGFADSAGAVPQTSGTLRNKLYDDPSYPLLKQAVWLY